MNLLTPFALAAAVAITAFCNPLSAATIDLSGQVNSDLTTYTNASGYPQNGGPITIGGIGFQLSTLPNGHTGTILTDASSTIPFIIPVGQFGVASVYSIANSAFGTAGHTAGQLTFNGSAGATFTYIFLEGDNIRDHATTGFNIVAPNVYATQDFGLGDRLDVQQIILPSAFLSQTLTSIAFSYLGDTVPGNGEAFLAALTTSTLAPVPLPATLPLFASGLGALALLARRRKQKRLAA